MNYHFGLNYSLEFSDLSDGGPAVYHTREDFTQNFTDFLGEHFGVPDTTAYAIANAVLYRMGDARLHYHTPYHVLAMLHCYYNLPEGSRPKLDPIVELAIWFHDVVYIPGAKAAQNEKDSADVAVALMRPWISPVQQRELREQIEATALYETSHTLSTDRYDVIFDLDLANLASPSFESSNLGIRLEFDHVSEEDWLKGRRNFLETMLNKPKIYRTIFFQKNFEEAARENLQKALEQLDGN